jgi:hypothetical protein
MSETSRSCCRDETTLRQYQKVAFFLSFQRNSHRFFLLLAQVSCPKPLTALCNARGQREKRPAGGAWRHRLGNHVGSSGAGADCPSLPSGLTASVDSGIGGFFGGSTTVCRCSWRAVEAACLAPSVVSPAEPQGSRLASRRRRRRVRLGASRTRPIARRPLLTPQSQRTPQGQSLRPGPLERAQPENSCAWGPSAPQERISFHIRRLWPLPVRPRRLDARRRGLTLASGRETHASRQPMLEGRR